MGVVRRTKSVAKLLQEFEKESKALSAVELSTRLQHLFNKTTIYRVLDKLEDDGVLHSFKGINGIKWYTPCESCTKSDPTHLHPHFECTSCGKVDCIEVKVSVPNIPNREVIFSQLLLQGTCDACL
tara:strand:- start:815 stop:1192 length:378 start_codon:yes stop_codon:yes gene_type:complete